jgi:hypothetical protein
MPSETMTDADVKKLDELIDRHGISELIRTLSMLSAIRDQRTLHKMKAQKRFGQKMQPFLIALLMN